MGKRSRILPVDAVERCRAIIHSTLGIPRPKDKKGRAKFEQLIGGRKKKRRKRDGPGAYHGKVKGRKNTASRGHGRCDGG